MKLFLALLPLASVHSYENILQKEPIVRPNIIQTNAILNEQEVCLGDCMTKPDGTEECTFTFELDIYASELGYYYVKECGEHTQPTLGVEKGKTYHFIQTDITNYYHPLGFAYYPDGAHDDVDELEPGVTPPGSSSDCADTMTCPAPMYMLNGEYLGKYSNNADVAPVTTDEDDFGLDVYEPDFFNPIEEWTENGEYSVYLKFDEIDDFTQDIFYFCHIHEYVSGRIKFVDSEGNVLNKLNDPPIKYKYDEPSEYDLECGTYGLSDYQLPNEECASTYVCDPPTGNGNEAFEIMTGCLNSMNCHMNIGMTTKVNSNSAIALFNHQMIPHHQNAVNMCKTLFKTNVIECDDVTDEDDSDCIMLRICMEIINGQNKQIQLMRDVLENKGYLYDDDCVVVLSPENTTASARNMDGRRMLKGKA